MKAARSGLVAVLFTDLVGSTELMSRLGDRAFDELRRTHFAALGQAVGAHGGEEIKNTGDGIMAVFPSAAEAVEAAVAMQQAAARQSTKVPIAIRVGLAMGEATLEGGDAFGTPVVEAARLVAASEGGQILVTAMVRAVASGRTAATFSDVGLLNLKGLPDPVPACEVAWEPLPEPSVPMPSLLTDVGRVFVGRETEMGRLSELWKEASAQELRVAALLAGEPGVGKTRLAAELAGRLHDEGAVVLAGRCDEDLGVPYQPFVEALRHFVDHTPVQELAGRLGRYGGELVRLVPELVQGVPELPPALRSDPETERYRLFDAVAAWLGAASTDQPVLLFLDDLQWAAKPTLLLLRHVVRSPELNRVLVLGTYRDTELGHDHPLVEVLADLRRQGGVERISLVGLDSSGVAAFMEQAAGHQLDEDDVALARAIHHETEGNPFFVREVLRHLTETGALERRGGRWATRLPVEEVGIPESVRDVVGRRLSRLSEEANQALRIAAVVGPEFELPVVQEAGRLDEEVLLSSIDEATEARLISEAEFAQRYRFAHALVRDTLYGELSAARRVAHHRRVAEAIETVHAGRLDDYLPALAHHFGRASAAGADTTRAVAYARRAGDRALALLAHDEAAAYYRQALELLKGSETPTDEAERLELLISLGEAQRRNGDRAHRETLLEAAHLARQRHDAGALARAALANMRGVIYSNTGEVDANRVATLEAALDALGEDDSPTRARLLASLGLELIFARDRERRLRLSDEALIAARRSGDSATLAHVLGARYYTILGPNTLSERIANTVEHLAAAQSSGDPVAVTWARYLGWRAAIEKGDLDAAQPHLEVLETVVAELGQPTLSWLPAIARAAQSLLGGHIEEAERAVVEAARFTLDEPEGPLVLAEQMFGVRLEQGRLEEVRQVWMDMEHQYPKLPFVQAMLARLESELGHDDDARRHFERLAVCGFEEVPLDTLWPLTMVCSAMVAAYLNDRPRAVRLHELLKPYPSQIAGAGELWLGSVSHYLGLLSATLGRPDEAEARFGAAEAIHERMGALTWVARTRLEWAAMLLAQGGFTGAERARELLHQAIATARQLALVDVERRAVALLSRQP